MEEEFDRDAFLADPIGHFRKWYTSPSDVPHDYVQLLALQGSKVWAEWMRWENEELEKYIDEADRQNEEEAAKSDGRRVCRVLMPDETLPNMVTHREANESARNWIREQGIETQDSEGNSILVAVLPDGRRAVWNPAWDSPRSRVLIQGSHDSVSMVLQQWVEEPVGEFHGKFAKVLRSNPRWQRTISLLRSKGEVNTSRGKVESELRNDGLPFNPSVVDYALYCLGIGTEANPARGGIVRTFKIHIVFDEFDPDSKEIRRSVNPHRQQYPEWDGETDISEHIRLIEQDAFSGIRRLINEESTRSSDAELTTNPAVLYQQALEEAEKANDELAKRLLVNVVQEFVQMPDWTTEEINLAFDACKKAHKAWIDAGSVVTVPKSEGKLPKGRPVKEDAIATDIASGLAEDKIIEREVQRVKAARFKKGMSLSPEERKKIEDRVKKRVRSRRKTKNS